MEPKDPFTWSSGWKSPIYCDNRKILSYPNVRTYIRQLFSVEIPKHFGSFDVVAGVATGGIPLGVLVAQELGLPFIYVRAKAKEHGLGNMVEGELNPGQSVVVIEDLISTGKSSIKAVEAVRAAGASVKGVAAVFSYGLKEAEDRFAEINCKTISLTDYSSLLVHALKTNFIDKADLDSLSNWREDPANWNTESKIVV